jgi:hypothetical protein
VGIRLPLLFRYFLSLSQLIESRFRSVSIG